LTLKIQVGYFSLNTSTGNQTISADFAAEAVIFQATHDTANADPGPADYKFNMGFSDNAGTPNQFAALANSADAASFGTTRRNQEVGAAIIQNTAGSTTRTCEFAYVSSTSSDFTINISTAPATAIRVMFMIFGGTDVANVIVGSYNSLNSAPTTINLTALGATPTVVFCLTSNTADVTHEWDSFNCFSVAYNDGSDASVSIGNASRSGVGTSDCRRFIQSTAVQVSNQLHNSASSFTGESTFAGFTASGHDISVPSNPYSPTAQIHGYLAMDGIDVKTGVVDTRTSAGNLSTISTGLGSDIAAVIIIGITSNNATNNIATSSRNSIGFLDRAGNQFVIFNSDKTGETTTIAHQLQRDDSVYVTSNSSTGAVNGRMVGSITGEDIDLEQFEAEGTARKFIWIALGGDLDPLTVLLGKRSYPRGGTPGKPRGGI